MQVVVPLRTFDPTIAIGVYATNFDILTGAAVLPASGTHGVAIQPDRRMDEAGCKKQVTGYKE